MSIFTGSELEFLAGLNKSWWRLYWKEFSRLRRIEAAAPSGQADGIAAFPAEFDACEDAALNLPPVTAKASPLAMGGSGDNGRAGGNRA